MEKLLSIVICIVLACIPAYIWGFIFYKKDPVDRPRAALTFLFGILSVLPILIYKWSWDFFPNLNVFTYTQNFKIDLLHFTDYLYLPLGTVFAFMFVGVIEEYTKHLAVVRADRGYFRNIDDAIEFSILAALGFAFIENILYFYYIYHYQGGEVLMVSFVFRSLFSTFAHILFSGIYGYFYGMAYFADPLWSEEVRKNRHPFIKVFHTILHLKRNRIFAAEKKSEGLLLAVVLHAIFNVLLELNQTFFMVPFLVLGYSFLDRLFAEKENHKIYGHLQGEKIENHFHHRFWLKFLKKSVE